MDARLLMILNGLAGKHVVLDVVVRFFVNDFVVPTALSLTLLALWFWGSGGAEREKYQRAVLLAIVSVLVANLMVKSSNLVKFRPRPFAVHPVTLLFYRPSDPSFPSNAATSGFSFAAAIWFSHRRPGAFMALLAALWALARVVAGVHYPSDIVAGAVIGILSAVIAWRAAPVLDPALELIIRLGRRLYLA